MPYFLSQYISKNISLHQTSDSHLPLPGIDDSHNDDGDGDKALFAQPRRSNRTPAISATVDESVDRTQETVSEGGCYGCECAATTVNVHLWRGPIQWMQLRNVSNLLVDLLHATFTPQTTRSTVSSWLNGNVFWSVVEGSHVGVFAAVQGLRMQ